MSSSRRRLLMLPQGEPAPAGYERLKYVEGNGKQYIVFPVYYLKTDVITLDLQLTAAEWPKQLFGAWGSGVCRQITTWNGDIYLQNVKGDVTSGAVIVPVDTQRHLIQVKNGDNRIDNHTGTTSCTYNVSNIRYYLWRREYATSDDRVAKMKVYKAEITNRCLLEPMLRLSDSKPCLYDSVSQTPIFNSGSGEFGYEKLNGTYVAPI